MDNGMQEGARRRVRALFARGWSADTLERAAGLPAWVTARTLSGHPERITPGNAVEISAAYERVWDTPPPRATDHDRALAEGSLTRARHWPPPMAWDDEQLDQADGRPAEGWKRGHARHGRSADLAEDVQFVREQGGYRRASVAEVAMRLGVKPGAVDKAVARTRQADREAG